MSSISFQVGSLGWMPPCLHKLVATQAWTYWHGRVQSASHTQFILRTGKKDEPVRQSALSTKSRRHEVDCWGGQCFRSSFGGGRQQESGGEVTLLGLPSPVRRPPASAPLAPLWHPAPPASLSDATPSCTCCLGSYFPGFRILLLSLKVIHLGHCRPLETIPPSVWA